MKTRILGNFFWASMACASMGWSWTAHADTWPNQPIRLIVPFAPGGPTDVVARHLANDLKTVLPKPVVIENKAGAQGVVGMLTVKDARPDGYTLLLQEIPGSFGVLPVISEKPAYNPRTDFTPISMVATGPIFLLVNNDVPAKNLKELIELSKKKEGGLTFGSSGGMGQMPTHMGPEVFKFKTGLVARNIVYKGAGPAMVDLAAGRVDFMMTTGLSAALPFLETKKIRVLGVTSRERQQFYPDAPTFQEQGYPLPELENGTIFGLFGPAGLPDSIVKKMSQSMKQVLADSNYAQELKPLMLAPYGDADTATIKKILDHEISTWSGIVKKLDLHSNE
jgi:tripartite-type tricarboxylate transporter receptor subunit TctC